MTIQREWLEWNKPCLAEATERLIERGVKPGVNARAHECNQGQVGARTCDLQRMICVLPGRRAGRLLLAQLAAKCAERKLQLIPPTVLTPGSMVDHALAADAPVANEVEICLAWMAALRAAAPNQLRALLPHRPPDADVLSWRELAVKIASLHAELAGQCLSFSDVADRAERMELMGEGERWRAIDAAHAEYLAILETSGLVDPHQARQAAVGAAAQNNQHLALIGVVELNALQQM